MIEILFQSTLFYFALPLLIYIFYNWLFTKKYNLPPGPKAWPLIGSIPDPYSSPLSFKRLIEDWKSKYGDVILFRRLGMNFVYVNDYKIGHKAFTQTFPKELAGRPTNSLDRLSVGDESVFFTRSLDSTWIELHKQILIIFRKVAEPSRMTDISHRAYDLFAAHIRGKKELVEKDGFYIEPISYWMGHNLLAQVFWQDTVEFKDPDYQDSIKVINKMMNKIGNLVLYDITLFNAIPHPGKKEIVELSKYLSSKIQKHIDKRREDETYITDRRYFIDHCMEIQDIQRDQKGKFANLPTLNDWYIVNLTLDIYFAGMDAFGIGFTWTVGLLALHPHVQDRIRKEISQIAKDTGEQFNDKWMDKLHYLNAVINEVMRIHSLSSFTSFHRAISDVKIGEYDIPKNTIVALNIYGAHRDPKYWINPNEFNPDRFLDEQGKFKLPKEGYMPFGVGRRTCTAERYIVKESHFIFTGRICQDFRIVWSSKNKTRELEEDMENTFFRHTAPFYVEFNPFNV